MTSMEDFKAASTWLSSAPSAASLSNELKLEVGLHDESHVYELMD
jgi:hypothetical protein